MDFKNAITLTCDKTKFLLPIEDIINIIETNSGYDSKLSTHIVVSLDSYNKFGLSLVTYGYGQVTTNTNGMVTVRVNEEFKLVATLLKGGKGAELLYGG